MSRAGARQRDLARIHILAKEVGLDDDVYRDVLWTIARVRSARDLDQHGRQLVIDHLLTRRTGHPAERERRRPKPSADRAPLTKKVEAQMRDLGVGDAYVDGIAKRMFGIERWTLCSPAQLTKITASLWYAQRRRAAKEKAHP